MQIMSQKNTQSPEGLEIKSSYSLAALEILYSIKNKIEMGIRGEVSRIYYNMRQRLTNDL